MIAVPLASLLSVKLFNVLKVPAVTITEPAAVPAIIFKGVFRVTVPRLSLNF